MAFSKASLKKFAHLARIGVAEDELENMNIGSIIEWIDALQKIDTNGIEPMLSPATHEMRFREDIATTGNLRDAVLANVPDDAGRGRGYFAVPKMIED